MTKKNGIAAFHDYADIFRDCVSLRRTRFRRRLIRK